jgi:hypothetical protein
VPCGLASASEIGNNLKPSGTVIEVALGSSAKIGVPLISTFTGWLDGLTTEPPNSLASAS